MPPPDGGWVQAQFEGASEDATKVHWITREPGMAGAADDHKDIFLNTNGGAPELMSPNTPNDDADFAWNTADGSHLFFGASFAGATDDGDFIFFQTGEPLTSDDQPAVGQMCFTQGVGELMVDCVAWGCIATPVQENITEVAPPDANLSQQRQGDAPEVFHLASPTPKAVSIAGTTPPACPSDSDPDPGPGEAGRRG